MLVLASKSPRRKKLLEEYVTSDFLICPSTYEEILDESFTPIQNVMNLAKNKGKEVFKKYPNDIVISSDTIVVKNNIIYGKPTDRDNAYKMLKDLSNSTHEVITAYCIYFKDKIISKYVVSKVTFNNLSDELINSYIDTGSPFDKAGGYGIQDEYGKYLVKTYSGSYNNIIGFPIEEIKRDLEGL